jgi:hypothetical protein
MQSNRQRPQGGITPEHNVRLTKRFGVFEFNTQARELRKHGVRLKVQEQPMQILAALLEQAGQIVPRVCACRAGRLQAFGAKTGFGNSVESRPHAKAAQSVLERRQGLGSLQIESPHNRNAGHLCRIRM